MVVMDAASLVRNLSLLILASSVNFPTAPVNEAGLGSGSGVMFRVAVIGVSLNSC